MCFSGWGGGRTSDESRINRKEKKDRLGNKRDGLTDKGRAARDRDPDNNFDFNDHAFNMSNRCSSCHSSDPSNPRNRW